MQIKCFILAKDSDNSNCQDSIAINIPNSKFVVTDGVTSSNMSHFFSQPLSRILAEVGCPDDESLFRQFVLQPATDCWNSSLDAYEAGLTGRRLMLAQEKRKDLNPGASTMLAVSIDNKKETINYHILGDSTLFVITANGSIRGISSCMVTDVEGHSHCVYGDVLTNFLMADGKKYGNMVSGNIVLPQGGYLMLMTDGIAEWFQETSQTDTDCPHKLWNLDDNEFKSLAEQARKFGKMDDDLALIMVHFDGTPSPEILQTSDSPAPIYLIPMPSLPALPLKPLFEWMDKSKPAKNNFTKWKSFISHLILNNIFKWQK